MWLFHVQETKNFPYSVNDDDDDDNDDDDDDGVILGFGTM
jgi:hypothetical protein